LVEGSSKKGKGKQTKTVQKKTLNKLRESAKDFFHTKSEEKSKRPFKKRQLRSSDKIKKGEIIAHF
jgi:hypothetical protein